MNLQRVCLCVRACVCVCVNTGQLCDSLVPFTYKYYPIFALGMSRTTPTSCPKLNPKFSLYSYQECGETNREIVPEGIDWWSPSPQFDSWSHLFFDFQVLSLLPTYYSRSSNCEPYKSFEMSKPSHLGPRWQRLMRSTETLSVSSDDSQLFSTHFSIPKCECCKLQYKTRAIFTHST